MRAHYTLPVLFVVAAITAGEVGHNFDRIPFFSGLSRSFLEQRLHISAPPFDLKTVITAVAKKHQVKEAFVKSIIKAESGFNPAAISPKGAVGLMQLMPTTAEEMGAIDPAVPEQNVDAGAKYLSILLKRYHNYRNSMVRAIAAYNAGPGWVDKYKGIPPFRETRDYVKRVLTYYKQFGGEPVQIADAAPKKHGRRHHARPVETEEAD